AENRHPPVPRVAEVDEAVRARHDVVRAVQLLALVVRGDHLAVTIRPVRRHADERARRVLAHEQAALRVAHHAVALVAGPHDLLDAILRIPAAPRISRHVAEEQELALRVPDRPLREGEARPELLDRGVLVDQLPQLFRLDSDGQAVLLSSRTETARPYHVPA